MAREERKLSEPPRRITALPALRQSAPGIGGDIGPALVDHPDDAERHPDPLDAHAVGPVPCGSTVPTGSGSAAMASSLVRDGGEAPGIEAEPVEKCDRRAGLAGLGKVFLIGREYGRAAARDSAGHSSERDILFFRRGERETARGGARLGSHAVHHRGDVAGPLDRL